MECVGEYYVLNGQLKRADTFDETLVNAGFSIYEVIRVINSRPVFLNDHYDRFVNSTKQTNKRLLLSLSDLRDNIAILVAKNDTSNYNIKAVMNYGDGGENTLVYNIRSTYPTDEQYAIGVKGITFNAVRDNPGSKVINFNLREAENKAIADREAYEALLVNEKGEVTEGSRSNVFLLKDDVLYTAPEDVVLCGITRKYIIQICEDMKLKIVYKCVKVSELHLYDAVLMTGTSPVVIAFNKVNDIPFDVDREIIKTLRNRLMAMMISE